MEIVQVLSYVNFVFFLGESLTSRYSRNTDQRLHASFSSGEFTRLKPKDMSSPLVSDHDSGRRVISPIRRRSDDDVSSPVFDQAAYSLVKVYDHWLWQASIPAPNHAKTNFYSREIGLNTNSKQVDFRPGTHWSEACVLTPTQLLEQSCSGTFTIHSVNPAL